MGTNQQTQKSINTTIANLVYKIQIPIQSSSSSKIQSSQNLIFPYFLMTIYDIIRSPIGGAASPSP